MEPKTNSGQVETILCSSLTFGYCTPFQSRSRRQVGRLRTLQAALDGNLFFLQLYTEVGGFLDAVHELRGFVARIWFRTSPMLFPEVDSKGRTALHYNCAGGSAQARLCCL